MGAVVAQLSNTGLIWDEHEAILMAINRGDAVLAEHLARRHGESAGEALANALDRTTVNN
jgi:DNA-binding GntR family transcriptional regulator